MFNYRNMMPTGSRAYGDEGPVSWTGYGFTGNEAVQVDDISALVPLEVYNGGFAGESSKPGPSSQYKQSAFQCWQQGFASSTVRILGTSDSKDRNHWLLRKCFSLLRRIPRNLEDTGHPSNYEMDDLANEIGCNSAAADEFATNHTLAERKRRKKQSDSYQALRSILPPSRKRDKASVLRSTVDYLKQLETKKEQLQERRRRLESLLKRQEQELELMGKLQSLGNRQTGMWLPYRPRGHGRGPCLSTAYTLG